jgi:hypothetical protein
VASIVQELAESYDLLARLADAQGLTAGVHPGYRFGAGDGPSDDSAPRE